MRGSKSVLLDSSKLLGFDQVGGFKSATVRLGAKVGGAGKVDIR